LTLIVSIVTPVYVVQVGDRLVTRQWITRDRATRAKPVDGLANKCVVYAATDAFVSISYTGIAFIQGKPTDVWLAETLEADVASGPHSPLRSGGVSEHRITLGAAVGRIARKLETDLGAGLPSQGGGVTLQLVGWQWRRRRAYEMPIVWHITNAGNGTKTTVHRLPRYWGWERGEYRISAIGDRRSDPLSSVQRRLQGRNELYLDFAQQVLVEAIREASPSDQRAEPSEGTALRSRSRCLMEPRGFAISRNPLPATRMTSTRRG
jgi:hypothetical protein